MALDQPPVDAVNPMRSQSNSTAPFTGHPYLIRSGGAVEAADGVAGVLNELLERRSTIHLPGGALDIDWADNDHVFMTGPAVEVFSGHWRGEGV